MTATQMVLFLCIAMIGHYIKDPIITASKGTNTRLKKALLQSMVQKSDSEVGLRVTGGQETAKELKLGMEIVRGRFKKIGDSILNVFCCELLRV